MTRRLFFAGIAALTLISTGCCGANYGCGGGACSWYPGKILGQAFACHGCGIGGYGGGWCGGGCGGGGCGGEGGGCGVGCDSCDGHGNWIGQEGHLEPSPQAMPGAAYYPRAVRSVPKPPAPPKGTSSNWGYRRRGVRPVSFNQQPGQQPGSCQDGRCACGRH
ncbi:MAG: hypothetical protein OES79_01720 [Planctomycetota bacterium]|nr:hypothetical protein [Planctomycetota bacterium]